MASQILRYTYGAIILHWVIAVLIIALLVVGLIMGDLPNGPQKYKVYALHKATGITVLLLSFVRLGWRLMHSPPPLPETMPGWEKLASRLSHWGFYVLMLGLPLSGWAMSSAGGYPISFFGLFQWPLLPGFGELSETMRKTLGGFFGQTHEILAFTTIGLLALHILAALKHGFFNKDEVVYRMTLLFQPKKEK